MSLTLLHLERPKLHTIFVCLSAIGVPFTITGCCFSLIHFKIFRLPNLFGTHFIFAIKKFTFWSLDLKLRDLVYCMSLTLLHSERPKLHTILVFLSAKGLKLAVLSHSLAYHQQPFNLSPPVSQNMHQLKTIR